MHFFLFFSIDAKATLALVSKMTNLLSEIVQIYLTRKINLFEMIAQLVEEKNYIVIFWSHVSEHYICTKAIN